MLPHLKGVHDAEEVSVVEVPRARAADLPDSCPLREELLLVYVADRVGEEVAVHLRKCHPRGHVSAWARARTAPRAWGSRGLIGDAAGVCCRAAEILVEEREPGQSWDGSVSTLSRSSSSQKRGGSQ